MANTTNYGWVKPDVGASDDAWGGLINTDLDSIDSTVKGVSNVASAAYPASNPSGYITSAAVPVASATTPAMNGTAAIGVGTTWARADHVHGSDTAKANVVGVIDGSSAAVGQVGEVISALNTTPVTLTTGTGANIATITVTAGDWDISGDVLITTGAAGATSMDAAISNVSATVPTMALNVSRNTLTVQTAAAVFNQVLPLNACRVNVTSSTSYYLVGRAAFASGTTTAIGYIWARRAR